MTDKPPVDTAEESDPNYPSRAGSILRSGGLDRALASVRDYAEMTEQELMALADISGAGHAALAASELQRRQIEASRELRESMNDARASADHAAKWLIFLTAVLVVLTVVIAGLTIVLVNHE